MYVITYEIEILWEVRISSFASKRLQFVVYVKACVRHILWHLAKNDGIPADNNATCM